MKKAIAMVLIVVMMLALGASAFAAGGPLTLEQAKQAALKYAGVKAADATFTKGHKDWDNGRQVYEIEFYANNTEYDMDVDVNTGAITDFSTEYHGTYSAPAATAPTYTQPVAPQPAPGYGYYYDDDYYDHYYDDDYYDHDRDWDDMFDHDFHYDYDDMFDWDD